MCNRGKAVNLLRNTHHNILFLGEHIYIYDLNTRTFSTVIEQEEQEIIGALLPIDNYKNITYLNDTKHIYELDNHTNRLKALYRCWKDTTINSVARDEEGNFWIGNNYGLVHYNPATKIQTPIPTSLFSENHIDRMRPARKSMDRSRQYAFRLAHQREKIRSIR